MSEALKVRAARPTKCLDGYDPALMTGPALLMLVDCSDGVGGGGTVAAAPNPGQSAPRPLAAPVLRASGGSPRCSSRSAVLIAVVGQAPNWASPRPSPAPDGMSTASSTPRISPTRQTSRRSSSTSTQAPAEAGKTT